MNKGLLPLLIQNLVGRYHPVTREYNATSAILKGSKGHFTIDPGMTIGEFEFVTTGLAADGSEDHLVEFSIELNSETIIDLNGKEINTYLRDYNKRKAVANRFTIPLSDMKYRSREGITAMELVTLPTDRLIVHVKFDETIAGTPTIYLRLRQTPSQPKRYFVPRIYSSSFDLLQSGRQKWKFPRFGSDKFIRRIHFAKAGINKVTVFQSDKAQNEMARADNDYDLEEIGKKAPQANVFHVDPSMYGFGLDGLQTTINALNYELDVDASGKCDFLVEMLEQVADLSQPAK